MKLHQIMENVKSTFQQAAALVKSTIAGSSTTIQELADYVLHHSETQQENRTLLGITYSFYHLEQEEIQYYLEMRGSHILQLDVETTDKKFVSYRSYRDQDQLHTKILLR
ncbi:MULTISPECIES: hypothetical protein [Bacillaceae]|uniref:Cell shape-determining protein MreC n=1 Tax=Peribacillus huizhouensis TaxID=1501239 RepID=A0ABR6CSU0_9BACI|nr:MULTISPECIES: hypothetical protein [Bacillaceae]MBA9028099.1 cell shape-determining protein MreC [Peribacillus huizhouensis]